MQVVLQIVTFRLASSGSTYITTTVREGVKMEHMFRESSSNGYVLHQSFCRSLAAI